MKGTHLGEFQEIVLLTVLVLGENAYGVSIQEEIGVRMGRALSRGALHAALARLEKKNFIQSEFGGATKERGGRRKKYYKLTIGGKQALEEAKRLREGLWSDVPQVSWQNIK